MTNFERGKRAAIEAVAEIFERIESANDSLEKAREEKDLVTFVYWFVLIHEYYYMLQKPLLPEELERIYTEMEGYSHIDYLKHKREQGYERLPDYKTTYGSGYNFPDIIGCAIFNSLYDELFTFYPDIKELSCGGVLVRQNLTLHFLQRGENREHVDYCDACGKNLNDQPYPYAYRCTECGRIFNLCAKCSEGQTHKNWGDVGRKPKHDYRDYVYERMFQQVQKSLKQNEIDQMFEDEGMLEFSEGGQVEARRIVSVVKRVLQRIKQEHERVHHKYLRKSIILYTYNDQNVKTMCVDECNNIYVSANFLYNALKMDEELIYALLMSATYRISKNSFVREQKFLSDGMPRGLFTTTIKLSKDGVKHPVELTRRVHHDINIANDLETNSLLIHNEIMSYDALKNEMNAICGNFENIPLFETLYHREIMDKFREEINLTFPINPSHKPSPETFIAGYRLTRIRIGKMVVKYGEEGTHKKLTSIIKYIRKDNLQSLQDMFNLNKTTLLC